MLILTVILIVTATRILLEVNFILAEVESKNVYIKMHNQSIEDNIRTGVTYDDLEAEMYDYDFKAKWDASTLNTANIEKYRQEKINNKDRSNIKNGEDEVKLNNYFTYGDNDRFDAQNKISRTKVCTDIIVSIINSMIQVPKVSSQRPEWKNVYRSESLAPPASGNVNPFKYSY